MATRTERCVKQCLDGGVVDGRKRLNDDQGQPSANRGAAP
jgi:hypothetical protein